MRVLITGASGFLGGQLTKRLLERGELLGRNGTMQAVNELVLADRVDVPDIKDKRIKMVRGDFRDAEYLCHLFEADYDSVFHLAATLTVEAENNFEQGLAVNVHGVMKILELCRAQVKRPRLIFPSSIAAFGGKLPDTVDDNIAQTPQTSYGTHKSITELLINDYSRHGFIDGRALRLPIVIIRPGKPNPSVSDRVASIVREPLLGIDVSCPLRADTRLPVASGQRVAEALIDIHNLPTDAFGHTRAMNLPSLTVSIKEMVDSLERFRESRNLGNIEWEPCTEIQKVVDGWPTHFVSERAVKADIKADRHIDEILDLFVEENLHG